MTSRSRIGTLVRIALCAGACVSAPVIAAPCAGFADVDLTSVFCPSVEWVRNRGVTSGCLPGLYCPDAPVSRLAMAAFMQRLGTALSPRPLAAEGTPGALDLDVPLVTCATADEAPAAYPRTAVVDGTLSVQAAGARTFAAALAWSTNGGATWSVAQDSAMRGGADADQWVVVPVVGIVPVDASATVRFGLRVAAETVVAGFEASDSRCSVRVLLFSRDGTTSPY